MRSRLLGLSLLVVIALANGFGFAQSLLAFPHKAGGLYALGETVHWQIKAKDTAGPLMAHDRF